MGFSETFKKLVGIDEVTEDEFTEEEIEAAEEQVLREENLRKPISGSFQPKTSMPDNPKAIPLEKKRRNKHVYTCSD